VYRDNLFRRFVIDLEKDLNRKERSKDFMRITNIEELHCHLRISFLLFFFFFFCLMFSGKVGGLVVELGTCRAALGGRGLVFTWEKIGSVLFASTMWFSLHLIKICYSRIFTCSFTEYLLKSCKKFSENSPIF